MPKHDWNWIAIVYLLGMPLAALALAPLAISHSVFTTAALVYAGVHFSLDCLSITVGYHRLFSHHAFKASPVVKVIALLVGAGTFQNSVLKWASDHRVHHREVDSDADPYSIRKGFWWAHILWMFHKDPANLRGVYPADLRKDALVQWQHRYYLPLAFLVGWGVPLLVGAWCGQLFAFFYVGVLLRLLLSGHCTFFINSLAHTWGSRPFSLANTARDNSFLSILTFGEGYHNFHHKFQADYRNGIRWYAWDPSKWIIFLLAKAGLCSDLVRVPDEKIRTARLEVALARSGVTLVDRRTAPELTSR